MKRSDEQSQDSDIYSNDHKRLKSQQQRQAQHSNAKKVPIVNVNEYISILNLVDEVSREVINGNNNFSSLDKELVTEDMKKRIVALAGTLGSNLQLPNGEPLPIDVLLEPEDQELLKEKKEWEQKSQSALRQNIQERRQMSERITPSIQRAIDIESSEVTRGTFDDASDNEGDLLSLDPKIQQDMKKEFTDSMELLKTIQKETPQRLTQYAKIGRILEMEKS